MGWISEDRDIRIWIFGLVVASSFLGGRGLLGEQQLCCLAAEAKGPEGSSPAEADLPDMPAPVPKKAPEGEKASSPAKPEPTPAKTEPTPGEKIPAQPPAEPKSAPAEESPAGTPKTKPFPKPAAKEKAEPPAQPKTPPSTKEKPAPSPEPKAEPSAEPKTELPAKEKTLEPLLEWPVDEAQRKNRSEVPKLLRAGTLSPEQIKFLNEYYTQYGLARWTQVANRAEVRKYREELLRELGQAEGQAHDQVVQMVMNLLIKMAEGNHHPAARVNAVLALGELNQVEPKPNKPPEPLHAAQPILLQMVQNPQTPDVLRVAALVGLRRHAELAAVADQSKGQWVTVLVNILQERSPSGRAAVGHAWLRQLAIEVLELLKTPGPNGQAALALMNVLNDTNASINLRVSAARALGNLDYSQGFPGDLDQLLRDMGQLALDVLNAELESYQKEEKFLARRLQMYLIGIYNGLSGLQKTASQPKETGLLYQKIFDAVRSCAVLFENPKLRDSEGNLREKDLVQELTKQKTALSEAIAAPVAPGTLPAEKQKTPSGG
ncbi:MAG: hypothetical protein NZ602_14765 [Thermoguttaceae bacterium]|nr:hypothetical protein [Thermoguttaceae bacterium]MDW8038003.1 hypothetical protein [Thermoguttaceae bacterium]